MNTVVAPPNPLAGKPLKDCKTLDEALQTTELRRRVAAALPSHVTAERMLTVFFQTRRTTPLIGKCDLRSVLGSMMTCAFLGLEPNTPLGQAYLIPYARRKWDPAKRERVLEGYDCNLVLGYQGLIDLSFRSGLLTQLAANAVMPNDKFSFEYGTNAHLSHRPMGEHDADADPTHVYMHARLKNGGESFEVLPWASVLRIRNSSQGYQAALYAKEAAERKGWALPATYTETPWVKHQTAMARKTAVRAGAKWLPRSVELAAALALDERGDRGRLDFGAVIDGTAEVLSGDLPFADGEPAADPGAAFGIREEVATTVETAPVQNTQLADAKPAAPAQAAPAQAAPAQAQASAPAPAQAQAQAPAPIVTQTAAPAASPAQEDWEGAWMVDEFGNEVTDVGDGGFFSDPVAFARAFVALRAKANDPQEFNDQNGPAIEDVTTISQEAARILHDAAQVSAPAATSAAPPPPWTPVAITIPQAGGKPDLRGYLAALADAYAKAPPDRAGEFVAAQRPTVAKLPPTTRKAAEKTLGIETPADAKPAAQAAAPPAAAAAAPTPEEARAQLERIRDQMIADIDGCRNGDEITLLGNNTAVARQLATLETEAPDLAAQVKDHAQARRAAIRGPANG